MSKDLKNLADEMLMQLYQEGEEMAFEILYSRHSSKVYSFLSKKFNNKEQASEIMQDTFFKLHYAKSSYNNQFPFLPWLFTIARNLMIDNLRKQNKSIKTIAINEEFTAVAEIETADNIDELAPLLKNLPDAQLSAIKLRYLEDWTFEDIAKSLKTNPANSRKLVSRGIKTIKAIFSTKEEAK